MANTVIAIKKSSTPSAVPPDLSYGELAINYADGKIYYKNSTNQIVTFSFQSESNAFGTVNANGTLVIADTTSDVLSLLTGNNIVIVGDAINDTITISLSDNISIPGSITSSNVVTFGTAFKIDANGLITISGDINML